MNSGELETLDGGAGGQCVTDALIVMTTCGSAAQADALAARLVETGHAGCVNIVPGLTSVYRWQGKVARDEEWLLLIKTTRAQYDRVQAAVVDGHSYELPEVVAVPIARGSDAYLKWLADSITC